MTVLRAWVVLAASLALGACGSSSALEPGSGDAGPSYAECTKSSECVIRPASCCGQCGAATREDAVAINQSHLSDYQNAHCADVGCATCYSAQDARLIATCDAGRCKLVDLAAHPSTACTADSQCRIRTNVCCECGGPTNVEHLIGVSSEPAFVALVCSSDQACPECEPIYPPGAMALCDDGHCEAVYPVY